VGQKINTAGGGGQRREVPMVAKRSDVYWNGARLIGMCDAMGLNEDVDVDVDVDVDEVKRWRR
jgi:hypothetical protein